MSVVPFQDFGIFEDQTRTWDGAAADKRIRAWVSDADPSEWTAANWRKYRSVHLWYDAASQEAIGSYHFMVCDIDGGAPKYVFRAASASLAVLRGGRGGGPGSNWWADRMAMERHVRRIYDKFDADFPERAGRIVSQTKTIVPFEVKQLREDGSFTGLASTYENTDLGGDQVVQGAFTKTIQERGDEVLILWHHGFRGSGGAIGKGKLRDTPSGLEIDGHLELELSEAREAYVRLKSGLCKALSIGYQTVKSHMKDGIRYLTELRLEEVSLATFPMNEQAIIRAVKQARSEREQKEEFLQALDEIQTAALVWQMLDACRYAVCSTLWDPEMTADEKVASIDGSVRDFHSSMMDALPRILASMGMPPQAGEMGIMSRLPLLAGEHKVGRRISAATKKQIEDAITALQALLAEEAAAAEGTSKSAEPPPPNPEPGPPHSWNADVFWNEWKTQITPQA